MRNYAYVTIINTKKYINGALCLYKSLEKVNSIYPFYVVVTGKNSTEISSELKALKLNVIEESKVIDIPIEIKEKNIKGGHENWNYSFDKLIIYSLTQFDKIVFLDADLYIVENIDHLFDKKHMTAATSGRWFPGKEKWTKLNSGLMVIEPSERLFEKIVNSISVLNKIDGYVGDQEVIWNYYSEWEKENELQLDEKYNVFFEHLEYYIKKLNYTIFDKNNDRNILVIHFVTPKPWLLKKGIRIKYLLYNTIKLNLKIVKVLYDYFSILKQVENLNEKKGYINYEN